MQQHGELRPVPAIIVMGVSGSGKSTLAALLAERFACPFLEGDTFHSEANVAKMSRGEPLTDSDRWPWLDRLGGAIGAAARADGRVVATCSALKQSYRERLRGAIALPTAFILLTASREELARRLSSRAGHYMPASLLDSQLATLEQPEDKEGALTLDSTLPSVQLAERVIEWLANDAVTTRTLA